MAKHLTRKTSTPSGLETRCFAFPCSIDSTISNDKSDIKRTSSQEKEQKRVNTADENKALLDKAKRDIAAMNEKAQQFRQRI